MWSLNFWCGYWTFVWLLKAYNSLKNACIRNELWPSYSASTILRLLLLQEGYQTTISVLFTHYSITIKISRNLSETSHWKGIYLCHLWLHDTSFQIYEQLPQLAKEKKLDKTLKTWLQPQHCTLNITLPSSSSSSSSSLHYEQSLFSLGHWAKHTKDQ